MALKYEIIYSLNLANVFPEAESLIKGVNDHLATMGFDERLTLRGRPLKMTLTLEREPSLEEIQKMKDIITAQLIESFPGSNPVCEAFRRKSGNVEQSAV